MRKRVCLQMYNERAKLEPQENDLHAFNFYFKSDNICHSNCQNTIIDRYRKDRERKSVISKFT